MKINHNDFMNSINQFHAVLVYGNDYGLNSQTCDQIIKQLISGEQSIFNFISLQYDNVMKNPELLYNECKSLSLTKEKKIIYITEVEKVMPSWLKDLLIKPVQDVMLIFKALELTSSAATRKFFEIEKRLASIACYHDTYITTENIIKTKLKQSNIKIDKATLNYLIVSINADRLITISELDKLIIFTGDNGYISLANVQGIVCNSSNLSVEDLCYDIAHGHITNFHSRLRKLIDQKTNIISIIRSITRLFQQLLKAKSFINEGVEIEQAIQKLSPTIFFKYISVFTKCLRIFSIGQLRDIISEFTQLELLCKTTNVDHVSLFEYTVLNQITPRLIKTLID